MRATAGCPSLDLLSQLRQLRQFRVQVILDESFDEYHIDGRAVSDLKRAIHQSLLDHGISLFPYVFLAKQSELDELEKDGD